MHIASITFRNSAGDARICIDTSYQLLQQSMHMDKVFTMHTLACILERYYWTNREHRRKQTDQNKRIRQIPGSTKGTKSVSYCKNNRRRIITTSQQYDYLQKHAIRVLLEYASYQSSQSIHIPTPVLLELEQYVHCIIIWIQGARSTTSQSVLQLLQLLCIVCIIILRAYVMHTTSTTSSYAQQEQQYSNITTREQYQYAYPYSRVHHVQYYNYYLVVGLACILASSQNCYECALW